MVAKKIEGLILDLDNCLFDTRSMGQDVILPVWDVLTESSSSFNKETLNQIKTDLWNFSLEDIVSRHDISQDIAGKMREAYRNLEAPIWSKCYEDIILLGEITLPKVLVTSGYSKLQWSKIHVTGVEGLFDEIIIESNDDHLNRKGKKRIFEEVMEKYGWNCWEVMVVGDNAFSELKAGKELEMITIQTIRPHVYSVQGFDHYVDGLSQIIDLIRD